MWRKMGAGLQVGAAHAECNRGAKGQMSLIGIPDMLHCVLILIPRRKLLPHSQHIRGQNKSSYFKILTSALFTQRQIIT